MMCVDSLDIKTSNVFFYNLKGLINFLQPLVQAQPVHADLVRRILGNKATFSPIVTLEPRRRKFHKPITMTIPIPKSSTSDGTDCVFGGDTPTLRLLCSITGKSSAVQQTS